MTAAELGVLFALAEPGTRWHAPCDLASHTGLAVLDVEETLERLRSETPYVNGHGPIHQSWSITELGLCMLMEEREAASP